MANTNVNLEKPIQHLFAMRMSWLRWLARPVRAIWRFLVFLAFYFWSTCVIAWAGMKAAWNLNYCLLGALGGAAAFLISLLASYLAVVTGLLFIALIGKILAVLPIAWAFGEIAAMIKCKADTGEACTLKAHEWGNGLAVLKYIGIYVGVLVLMALLQVALDLVALIPGVGASVAGIALLPNVVASSIMILTLILLYYAMLVLPAHLLHHEVATPVIPIPPPPEPEEVKEEAVEEAAEPEEGAEPDAEGKADEPAEPKTAAAMKAASKLKPLFAAHLEMTKSYFAVLSKDTKWLRYILITIPIFILGMIISIPLLLLVAASVGLTMGIGGGVGVGAMGILDPMQLVAPGGNPFFVLAWGAPVSLKIGAFFFALSLAPILGAAYSLFWSNAANSFYLLYKEKRD